MVIMKMGMRNYWLSNPRQIYHDSNSRQYFYATYNGERLISLYLRADNCIWLI